MANCYEMVLTIMTNDNLVITRNCPMCGEFLNEHPTLHTNINQKQRKDGGWYHTSPHGRSLHRLVLRKGGDE